VLQIQEKNQEHAIFLRALVSLIPISALFLYIQQTVLIDPNAQDRLALRKLFPDGRRKQRPVIAQISRHSLPFFDEILIRKHLIGYINIPVLSLHQIHEVHAHLVIVKIVAIIGAVKPSLSVFIDHVAKLQLIKLKPILGQKKREILHQVLFFITADLVRPSVEIIRIKSVTPENLICQRGLEQSKDPFRRKAIRMIDKSGLVLYRVYGLKSPFFR
jgi:hypothetical protein